MSTYMYTTSDRGDFVRHGLNCGMPLSGITSVSIDSGKKNTDFLGFGVAITGSSCYNLSKMDPEQRHTLLKSLYSREGLGFGIGRLSIGASDYSAELYTYCDEKDMTLKSFSIEKDREYIIPIIKEIVAINPEIKLFASPWSPPAWMKTGGSLGGGFMREEYIDVYAEYFVKFIKAYAEEGIRIYAVTPQNENETHQDGKMPACIWHPDLEARFAIILKEKLIKNGLDTKIWFHDHNFSGYGRVDWCLGEYPSLISSCDGIAFHYYSGNIEQTEFLKGKYPTLPLHFTEGGPRLYDNYGTDWCKWSLMMIKALNCGYSSFTGWNLMLDEAGGPNIGPFFCGGLVTVHSQSGELTYSGQYKAFRHFSDIDGSAIVCPLRFDRSENGMFSYDGSLHRYSDGCAVILSDGSTELIIVNPTGNKEQLQYQHNGKWCYIEMLPNTVATIILN